MQLFSTDKLDPGSTEPSGPDAFLAGILDSAMDAIVTVDAQQKIVMFNCAAEKLFGWSKQEMLLQPLDRLIPQRARSSHGSDVERFGQTNESSRRMGGRRVVHGLRRNGEEFPLDASISVLDTPTGKLYTAIIRDMSELDRLQKEQVKTAFKLSESQRRLQLAQRLARIGYWQFDLDTNSMWWCDESPKVVGVDRARLGGTYAQLLELIHPGDRTRFELERDAAVQAGLPFDSEFRVITAVHEVRWIQMLGWPEENDKGEKTRRRTGLVREITARKRSERISDRSVELLNRTGKLARVGGWELVLEPRLPYCSEEIYCIHELDPSMRGALKDLFAFYAPEAQLKIRTAVRAAMDHATPWDLDLPLITAKGRRIWVRSQGRAFQQAGKVVRLFGVMQDITDSKATEAALRLSNQELEAFSYSVSHDLRSPLNTINGFSHLLAKKMSGTLDREGRHYLSRIQVATKVMGQLIEGLLALAQVARAVLHTESVDLSAMARSILDGLQAHDPERKASFQIESGLLVMGDERLVRVVMENLLGNAWKFSARTVHTWISVGQKTGGADSPAFFVRDNGAGFDMTYVDKLFTPFQRLHATTEFPGMGIGLATVSRVIARHGGRLWAESVPGQGAGFFFTLPSDPAAAGAAMPA